MMWQDITITICNVVFTYALIIQAYTGFKLKKTTISFQTALLTTIALYVVAFVYLTLNLYFSTVIGAINGTLWLTLLWQKLIYRKT